MNNRSFISPYSYHNECRFIVHIHIHIVQKAVHDNNVNCIVQKLYSRKIKSMGKVYYGLTTGTPGGGGHSGTQGGRTRVTYFAEEGVFL